MYKHKSEIDFLEGYIISKHIFIFLCSFQVSSGGSDRFGERPQEQSGS